MSLVSSSIPNLINGVSQQPPSLRLSTQAELQENALSSVVEGLVKRPASQHVAVLDYIDGGDKAFVHPIKNSEGKYYTSFLTNEELRIYDKNGNGRSVGIYAGDYLFRNVTNPAEEISAVTVGDTTFFVNKTVTTEMLPELSPKRTREALVYIKQGDYKTRYTLRIRMGSKVYTRTVETMASTQDTATLTAQAEESIQTERIGTSLLPLAIPTSHYDHGGSVDPSASQSDWENFSSADITLDGSVTWASWMEGLDYKQYGNVLHFYTTSTDIDFDIQVYDSRGNQNIFAFKETVADFDKLPPNGPVGFEIGVVGDNAKGQDDYYVKLDADETGAMVWKECVKGGLQNQIDSATMPHKLTGPYSTSPEWRLEPCEWKPRRVGDDDTNPIPSFIGFTLNDIFFHRNRLGFLADENVIFSEAGEFDNFNFFLKTTLTLLDSDVIDVAVSNNKTSVLKHAVPFNQSLLMFSDLTQFKLDTIDLLSPSTVKIDVVTQFEADLKAKPSGAGRYVFFATQKGEYAGVREYYVDEDSQTNDAADITAHVPSYLKGQIKHFAASTNEDTLLALTTEDPNSIYVYRYYWQGTEKLQSSWSKWTFTGQILSANFNVSDIELVTMYNGQVCLERIALGADSTEALTDAGHPILLDRRVRVYPATGFDEPQYNTEGLEVVYVGKNGSILSTAQKSLALYNNEPVWAGIPYTFRYVFSEFVVKNDKSPITTGRLQVRNLAVVYSDTGFFETVVTPQARDPKVSIFNGRKVGEGTNILNQAAISTGTYSFWVLGNSTDTTIELRSSSHLPCGFQSAEWEGFFRLRSRRI